MTLDGLRWQEVFRGLDARLLADERYTSTKETLEEKFASTASKSSAERLLPFLHGVVFQQGSVLGNRDAGSCARVTNPWYFSYPGYNEILTGSVDKGIDSNASILNPNVTMLEWLQKQESFQNRVAVFGSWDVFPFIYNTQRSAIPVNVGPRAAPDNSFEEILNQLHQDIPSPWPTVRLDAFTHHYALSYLRNHQPRVLHVAYGETDDFAHDGDYDQYIMAANRTDRFIRELWDFLQSEAQYRDNTVLFITVDHGRGEEPLETWEHHASKESLTGYMQSLAEYEEGIVGSDAIWMAALGPGIVGGAGSGPDVTKSAPGNCAGANQIAATLLTLLGQDHLSFNPQAGAPLTEMLAAP
ncbi:MAG: phosphoglyceromutase [Gammaproteobacteria bacterium]|nr:phosphoglyceromutase [Gammaproteobacteria bacterium]